MATFLFEEIIFGPIKSRRLGISLGINLLPEDVKYCTYDCIYCECGWTYVDAFKKIRLHSAIEIKQALESKLISMQKDDIIPNNLTFAGNGEPTAHPEFSQIIEDTIKLRDKYYPDAQISVLTNATQLHKKTVFQSLKEVDQAIMKLDAVDEELYKMINRPQKHFSLEKLIQNLKEFDGNLIIQTMFLRGEIDGKFFDNTTESHIKNWVSTIEFLKPVKVMIYSIDRDTPAQHLKKCSAEELNSIAKLLNDKGFNAVAY